VSDLRQHYRAVAEALPVGTAVSVPRELLLELLEASAGRLQTSAVSPDLTVADLCTRFSRKPSAVRAWLERGDFPGAYRLNGREWRVPPAAVEAFEAAQRGAAPGGTGESGKDLGAWRRMRRA
jgi:hypothetical protein